MTNKKIKIKLIVLDIDGVLTNGRVTVDIKGNEYKNLNYRDMDTISLLKQNGLNIALLTGEDTMLVDVIANRLGVSNVVKNAKDKEKSLRQISENTMIPLENICYIGDADRDIDALKLCDLSMVPRDATNKAKESASYVLETNGGDGLIQEVKEYLIKNEYIEWRR